LQHESDIRHQVDGVVPDEHNPWAINVGVVGNTWVTYVNWSYIGVAHHSIVP
jgi:hypothetical protein